MTIYLYIDYIHGNIYKQACAKPNKEVHKCKQGGYKSLCTTVHDYQLINSRAPTAGLPVMSPASQCPTLYRRQAKYKNTQNNFPNFYHFFIKHFMMNPTKCFATKLQKKQLWINYKKCFDTTLVLDLKLSE